MRLDHLYDEHLSLLENHDFDPVPAGAQLLGEEARAMVGDGGRSVIHEVLHDTALFDALSRSAGPDIADNRRLFLAYRSGWA